ncbi:helix-turn-helix domain-containing protein [Leptolyngbya ohadii]|uniref:helix-turn-helix domain-containing protein n=1 Tax=Leptolyngbya ohadii TaxID=1962290 RepID=UPI000B59DB65|nr:helix-turn-helix transcriptional regulator [Leptolyngbya ohadii]
MSTAKIRSADTVALVRSLRELYELTQEQFAAKLGVSLVTINRWENDRAKPTPLALRQIKALLLELSQAEPDQAELNPTELNRKISPERIAANRATAKHLLAQYFPEER